MKNLPYQEVVELLKQIANGDQNAAYFLHAIYKRQILNYVRKQVNNFADAEDIAALTMADAFLKPLDYENKLCEYSTWLCSIANHKIADHRRKRYVDPQYLLSVYGEPLESSTAHAADVAELYLSEEKVKATWELLNILPPAKSEVVRRWVNGESQKTIALTMGIPLGTVKSRLNNAIKLLQAKEERAPSGLDESSRCRNLQYLKNVIGANLTKYMPFYAQKYRMNAAFG